jgi:pimeloyl-ACP methyl ester carboxylesterase
MTKPRRTAGQSSLIPLLATQYHLIAPDFPSFGQSEAPPPSSYVYTFDHLAKTTGDLLEQLKISKCSLYLHDYGGPVGFRIILARPERVQALTRSRLPMSAHGTSRHFAAAEFARYRGIADIGQVAPFNL